MDRNNEQWFTDSSSELLDSTLSISDKIGSLQNFT